MLGITLIGGAFYCGWLCPFGFLQDLSAFMGRKLGIKKRQMPRSIHKMMVYSRYILAGAVLFWTADVLFTLISYEPRGAFLGVLAGTLPSLAVMGVLLLFLGVSLFYERFFCRYFCIEGARLGALSMFRLLTLRRDPGLCVSCSKCDKACPMQIRVSTLENLRSPQCVNCMTCISACPVNGALRYGVIGKTCTDEANPESTGETENRESA